MALTFTVLAEAQPKGSIKALPSGRVMGALKRGGAFTVRSMREFMTSFVLTSDNAQVKSYQSRVAFEATTALRGVQLELAGALHLTVNFYLPRPSGLAKSYTGPHLKKPDVDKLLRSTLDALTGVLWKDDSQVTRITAGKDYACVDEDPRVVIIVRPIATDARVPLFDERTGTDGR